MKIWCTVTLKKFEKKKKEKKVVYCNLAAILHIFFLSNNIQITAWSDDRGIELEMKSCLNSFFRIITL